MSVLQNFVEGNSYIVRNTFGTVNKIRVMELTQTTIKVEWVDNKTECRYDLQKFKWEYRIIEDLHWDIEALKKQFSL